MATPLATACPDMASTTRPPRWHFFGVLIAELTEPGSPVTVAEGVLPEGASPRAHVHAALDDSFYLLEGDMVVCCGDEVWEARAGSWVQFPAGGPHTFRVLDGPARVLVVHANDSFLAAVREIGQSALDGDTPNTTPGPTVEELNRAFAAHGITNVGPPIEQDEAARLLHQTTTGVH